MLTPRYCCNNPPTQLLIITSPLKGLLVNITQDDLNLKYFVDSLGLIALNVVSRSHWSLYLINNIRSINELDQENQKLQMQMRINPE